MDRIILSDENTLNSYGFRVLTEGIDLSRFDSNPVMLWGHQANSTPIGRWKDLRIEDGRLTAEPEFDMEDEFAANIARKYEKGFVNAASVGLILKGFSEAEEDMLPGQAYPTVTKCELAEASLVSVPSNGSAVRLYDLSGQPITLADPEAISLYFNSEKNMTEEKNSLKEQLSALRADLKAWLSGASDKEEQAQEQPKPVAVELAETLAALEEKKLELAELQYERAEMEAKIEELSTPLNLKRQ